jgi:hypothetical protein
MHVVCRASCIRLDYLYFYYYISRYMLLLLPQLISRYYVLPAFYVCYVIDVHLWHMQAFAMVSCSLAESAAVGYD